MKRTLLSLLLAACSLPAIAQSLHIEAEKSAGGTRVTFVADRKEYPGTTTVYFTLKDLSNCKNGMTGTEKMEIAHEGQRVKMLNAANESHGVGYSYGYYCYNCRIDTKIDENAVYRMPCTTRRPIRVHSTVYVYDKHVHPDEEHKQLGYRFQLEKGDTVYCARRGRVVKIERPEPSQFERGTVSFSTETVNITIEHPDGSEAWYICVDPESLMVETGDDVMPGDPLALAGTYDYENYNVSLQIYRYVTDPSKPGHTAQHPGISHRHLFPRFATTEGDVTLEHGKSYTAVMNDRLYTHDMSKKEQKRFAGNKR